MREARLHDALSLFVRSCLLQRPLHQHNLLTAPGRGYDLLAYGDQRQPQNKKILAQSPGVVLAISHFSGVALSVECWSLDNPRVLPGLPVGVRWVRQRLVNGRSRFVAPVARKDWRQGFREYSLGWSPTA